MWEEIHDSVVVTDGLFTVLLGSIIPVTPDLFTGEMRALGVTVGGAAQLFPFSAIVSTAYAFRFQHADTAITAMSVAGGGGRLTSRPTN